MKIFSRPQATGGGVWDRFRTRPPQDSGSTFVIVLWIAFGLVSLAIYFAQSMSYELRASDARVCSLAAEQAIAASVRYLTCNFGNLQTNGVMPDPATYLREAVPVGDSHFWLIGRDTNDVVPAAFVSFGLIDEASKLNLNTATSNMLVYLPRMSADLTVAILDWRDTNGGSGAYGTYYGMQSPPYQNKSAPFDTVEELKLLYGADLYTLAGEDLNHNGMLDPNETDENRNGIADPGVLDYLTVYSREPNTYSNGTPRVDIRNVSQNGPLPSLLQSTLNASRASQILTARGLVSSGGRGPGGSGGGGGGGGRGGGGGGGGVTSVSFTTPLQFYRRSGMTPDEFAKIANAITVTAGSNYIEGRVNVNTASSAVLNCLPGLVDNPGLAKTLVTYRVQNPTRLTSIAWVVEALGQNNTTVLDTLSARDCITTQSYQFTADVAALGPHGRGYRRVRLVFDTVDGPPKIVYRQDLTHLGWALGKDVRQTWLFASKDNR
jgi:DNA uptake protein ComE-like DNA-binding protein